MQSQLKTIQFAAPMRNAFPDFLGKAVYTDREVETMVQERFAEGWEAGQKALGSQLVQQRADLLQLQSGAIASLKQAVEGVVSETEEVIGALVVEFVGKFVGETAVDAQMIRGVVSETLKGVAHDSLFELRLNPVDLELFHKVQGELEITKNVEITGDPSLQPGDCVVRTKFGIIDARRSTKLKNLEKAVGL